jgi:hypothetical protein
MGSSAVSRGSGERFWVAGGKFLHVTTMPSFGSFRLELIFLPGVRVLLTKSPEKSEFIPFDVFRFEVGKVYEMGPRLAELFIVCGYGEPERRSSDRDPKK